jgi:hypothetical protein
VERKTPKTFGPCPPYPAAITLNWAEMKVDTSISQDARDSDLVFYRFSIANSPSFQTLEGPSNPSYYLSNPTRIAFSSCPTWCWLLFLLLPAANFFLSLISFRFTAIVSML